jgi:hypothetical protein
VIPAIIIIIRHVDLTIEETTSIMPFVLIGIIVSPFIYFKVKKRNEIMKIRETKEIEDNNRKVGTILHFYIKFSIIYFILFLMMYYVQFNFKPLTGTMQWVGLSLLVGSMLRINLAQKTGY